MRWRVGGGNPHFVLMKSSLLSGICAFLQRKKSISLSWLKMMMKMSIEPWDVSSSGDLNPELRRCRATRKHFLSELKQSQTLGFLQNGPSRQSRPSFHEENVKSILSDNSRSLSFSLLAHAREWMKDMCATVRYIHHVRRRHRPCATLQYANREKRADNKRMWWEGGTEKHKEERLKEVRCGHSFTLTTCTWDIHTFVHMCTGEEGIQVAKTAGRFSLAISKDQQHLSHVLFDVSICLAQELSLLPSWPNRRLLMPSHLRRKAENNELHKIHKLDQERTKDWQGNKVHCALQVMTMKY